MAGAVALASTGYIAAIDESLGGATSARPGVPGFPQREPALPTETAREPDVREAQGRVILLERGLDRSQLRPRGQAVVRRTVPLRSLDDWLVLRVINSFTAPVLPMIYRKRSAKNLWGAYASNVNTNILGRPATGRVTSRRDRAGVG